MRGRDVVRVAGYVGAILLRSGAGPARASEAMASIGRSLGAPCLRGEIGSGELVVQVARRRGRPLRRRWQIARRERSLRKICEVNALTASIVRQATVTQATVTAHPTVRSIMARLAAIDRAPGPNPLWIRCSAAVVAATAIAMLAGGDCGDVLPASLTAAVTQVALLAGRRALLVQITGGVVAASTALALQTLGWTFRLDLAISAGVIPFVPGLLLADAVASLLAGAPRLMLSQLLEGIVKAAGLAGGVGAVLAVWRSVGGAA